jgi:hypothetical protein
MNKKEIKLIDIVKLQHYYIERWEEEDGDYVNYRRVGQFNRREQEILDKITDNRDEQRAITNIIAKGSWNSRDMTFKTICNEIRALGYEVINNG